MRVEEKEERKEMTMAHDNRKKMYAPNTNTITAGGDRGQAGDMGGGCDATAALGLLGQGKL